MKGDTPHIVFLHKDFPYSGAEQVTMDIANHLCQHGWQVTILAIHHREKSYPAGAERLFRVESLPQGNIKYSRRVAKAVRDFVETEGVDVLVTYREVFYAQWLKRHTGVRIVYELHNMPYYECQDIEDKRRESRWKNIIYGMGLEWLTRAFYRAKYRRIYGWCDGFGLLCEAYRRQLTEILHLKADNKTWVLPNPIERPRQVTMEKENWVVYVGRLTHRDKRVDRLLRIWQRAMGQMPHWHLKIVGDGKCSSQLKELSASLHLERASFEGYSTKVHEYYDQAAILCLTSSFEGWPMSMAEAQANGVVPIVFNSFAGAEDLISSSDEGILVPPYDEPLFAQELAALANDGTRLRRMSQACVDKSLHYNIERSGQAWIAMLHHIMNGKP